MPTPILPRTPRGKRISSHELCPWCCKRRQAPLYGYPDLCVQCRHDLMVQQVHIAQETLQIAGARDAITAAVNARLQGYRPKRDRRPKPRRLPASYKAETCWSCGRNKADTDPLQTLFCADCRAQPCAEPGCELPCIFTGATQSAGEYLEYCQLHHNQRAYCFSCGDIKEDFGGLPYCGSCQQRFDLLRQRLLAQAWRKTSYACPRCRRQPRLPGQKYCVACSC